MLDTFYRDRLSSTERTTYDALCRGIENMEKGITAPVTERMSRVISALDYDRPDFFYVNWLDSIRWTVRSGVMTVRFPYVYKREEIDCMNRKIHEIADGLTGFGEYGKSKAVHDWIVKNITYDRAGLKRPIRSPDTYSAAGAILLGRAVCEGISKLACLLYRIKGIDACVAVGSADDGVGHAWNALSVNGRVLYSDITYDAGLTSGEICRKYFNVTKEEITKDHTFLWV